MNDERIAEIEARANAATDCYDGYHVCSTWEPCVYNDIPDLIAALREAQATIAAVRSNVENTRDGTLPGEYLHDSALRLLAILDGGKP